MAFRSRPVQVGWTQENYPKVREHLYPESRVVFDRMVNEGLRLREAANTNNSEDLSDLAWDWNCACEEAGLDPVSSAQPRLDYIWAKYTRATTERGGE